MPLIDNEGKIIGTFELSRDFTQARMEEVAHQSQSEQLDLEQEKIQRIEEENKVLSKQIYEQKLGIEHIECPVKSKKVFLSYNGNILVWLFLPTLLAACSSNVRSDLTQEGMVQIPSGEFTMGGRSNQAYQDEFPRHKVEISSFYMDKYEVTNQDFLEFVEATGYLTIAERDIDWEEIKKQLPNGTLKPPDPVLQAGSLVFQKTSREVNLQDYSQWWKWTIAANWRHPEGPGTSIENRMNHPVVHIAWEDANAYAEWAGKRLPTEAEWEWAASGGDVTSKYPWGNESIEGAHNKANFWQGVFPMQNLELDGYLGTAPIGSFPPNKFGLYDMAGNVWEWCRDKYDVQSYVKDAQAGLVNNPSGSDRYYDPTEPNTPKHVIRGGSFLCNDSYCSGYRVSRRMSSSKDSGFNHTGFRCVRDVVESKKNN